MKILFLYSEYVNYLDGLMRHLVVDHGAAVCVISWDKNLLKPQSIPQIPGVLFEKRSAFSVGQIVELIEGFEPQLVYISGWMDPGYLDAVQKARNRKMFTTVCGFDDNWLGTLRQRLGAVYFRFFLRKFFDKAWVAGARQYHYARWFGYTDTEIAFNMLSCNTALFDTAITLDPKKDTKLRKFFYVGNFREVKGTDLLAEAYRIYREDLLGSCELVCIGQGPLRDRLNSVNGITVLPYMSSSELVEVTSSFDVFIFPSRKDQWGVALHEFALRGFPLLSSIGAGATESFLIAGFNGLMFDIGDHHDLAVKMKIFEEMPSNKLTSFGQRSRQLGQTISSELSAASLISFVLN